MMIAKKKTNLIKVSEKKVYATPQIKTIGDIKSKTLGKTNGTGDATSCTPPLCSSVS